MCVTYEVEDGVTHVSACGLQRQSNKGKPRSNEVTRSPRLHIEHLNSYYDETIQTRTFWEDHMLISTVRMIEMMTSYYYRHRLQVIEIVSSLILVASYWEFGVAKLDNFAEIIILSSTHPCTLTTHSGILVPTPIDISSTTEAIPIL